MEITFDFMYFIVWGGVRRQVWSCPGFRSNGPTWFRGSRHWSRGRRKNVRVICQRKDLETNFGGVTCSAPRWYDNSRDGTGAIQFYVHLRNPVTLLAMDDKDRSSPVDSTWKKWHLEGPMGVCCSFWHVRSKAAKPWMSVSRILKPWRTCLFRPSLIATGVYP